MCGRPQAHGGCSIDKRHRFSGTNRNLLSLAYQNVLRKTLV